MTKTNWDVYKRQEHNYSSNIIIRDMAEELLEEDAAQMTETKTGLTEVFITIEGKDLYLIHI